MKYFVAYYWKRSSETGIGSVCCECKHAPPTVSEIKEIQNTISESMEADNVCIFNVVPLSED